MHAGLMIRDVLAHGYRLRHWVRENSSEPGQIVRLGKKCPGRAKFTHKNLSQSEQIAFSRPATLYK
jgi:hypothetical protein